MMTRFFVVLALVASIAGCAENYTHDEELAAKAALQFAEVTFVRHDLEQGWRLLADNARAYVPLEKFQEIVTTMHRKGFPNKVLVAAAAPVRGEKVMNVSLRGEVNEGNKFYYTFSLTGTSQTGYRVVTFSGGGMGSF